MPKTEESERWRAVSHSRALAAAVPLLLYGMLVGGITVFLRAVGGPSHIVSVARASVWHNTALAVGVVALAALVAAAVAAIGGRLPVWSYTWVGAGLTGLLIVLNLVSEDRRHVISPVVDGAALALFLLSGLIAFGAAVLRGWQHVGLLNIGLCAALGLSLCFFGVAGPYQLSLGLMAVVLGVLEAALVYVYIRRSNPVRIATLIAVALANVWVAWVVESLFRSRNPSRGLGQFWLLAALLTGLLFGGTLLGLPGRFVGRMLHRLQHHLARSWQ